MASRLPTLRGMQAFEAIGRTGSVTTAARELSISAGAVSQHLTRLEEQLGLLLFERHGRSLKLTSWGLTYLKHVQSGFDHLRTGSDLLHRARSSMDIIISAPPSISTKWLGGVISRWTLSHPDMHVRIVGEDEEPVLEERQYDFRISYGAARLKYSRFKDLFKDRVTPMCSPAYLRAHPVQSPRDVFDGTLIEVEWRNPLQSPPSWSEWAARWGVDPKGRFAGLSFSLSSAAIDAAIDGGGFVLGQASLAGGDLQRGSILVACKSWIEFPEPYALAWNHATIDRLHVRELRDHLVQVANALSSDVFTKFF